MKNRRELFTTYHDNHDNFPAWLDHHLEMHRRWPLGCAEFGEEWLQKWAALGRVLVMPGQIEFETKCPKSTTWVPMYGALNPASCADCLHAAIEDDQDGCYNMGARRVVLLDGTVVKKWPAESMGEQIRRGLEKAFAIKTQGPYLYHHFGSRK